MENHQSSYYSVSYGLTALKICHYTVHEEVVNNIFDKNPLNSTVLL